MPFKSKGKDTKSVYQKMVVIKKAWHFAALEDYLMGMSFPKIAEKYHKSTSSVNALFHSPAFISAINNKTADLEKIFAELVPVIKKTITALLSDEKVDPETKSAIIFKILDRIGMPAVEKKKIESGPITIMEDKRIQTLVQNLDSKKNNIISKVLEALDDTLPTKPKKIKGEIQIED